MTDDTTEEPEIETGENHLTIRRTFDAPRERVWQAFTDADELEEWFVPEGMTAEVHANELEPGGAMAIHWSDGENRIENEGYYVEVVEHERLVSGEEIEEGELRLTYEFRDVDDGTEVVITQEFPDGVPDGAAEGWTGMLDALDELLEARSTEIETSETSLTIRRTFDAPREHVWRAFTVPEEVEQWLGPGSMTGEVHALELEPGGAYSVSMAGESSRYDVEGEVLEVIENERLVHTWEPGRVTIELRDVDEGCEVVFTHEGFPDAGAADGHAAGWESALDNLTAVL